jgi:hypothetical protein
LSRAERCELLKLSVQFEKSGQGNFTAPVWKYYGELSHSDDDRNVCIDKESRYCALFLQREQKYYTEVNGKSRHVSRIKKYSRNTSTGSLADHLFTVHDVDVRGVSTCSGNLKRQLSIEQSLAVVTGKPMLPAATEHEMNIDLCLMVCTHLLPFSIVSGVGVKTFFAKNFPEVHLPSESTLSTTALYDLHRAMKSDVNRPYDQQQTYEPCGSQTELLHIHT